MPYETAEIGSGLTASAPDARISSVDKGSSRFFKFFGYKIPREISPEHTVSHVKRALLKISIHIHSDFT
jgi:hypothetical protein